MKMWERGFQGTFLEFSVPIMCLICPLSVPTKFPIVICCVPHVFPMAAHIIPFFFGPKLQSPLPVNHIGSPKKKTIIGILKLFTFMILFVAQFWLICVMCDCHHFSNITELKKEEKRPQSLLLMA
jgi:hypothetical protein